MTRGRAAKRVRIAVELSESFVRLLNAHMALTGGIMPDGPCDVAGVLARVVLAEARGATEEDVHAIIPPQWRPDIEAVHGARTVVEDVP